MSLVILWFLILFSSADTGIYQTLADGDNETYKAKVYDQLQKETSIFKKREILKAVALQRDSLYDLKAFEGKVLPYNSGCLKGEATTSLCSTYDNFQFFLTQEKQTQTLEVIFQNKSLLKHTARSRSHLKESHLSFGKALHLIIDTKTKGTFFLLIREIEAPKERQQSIRETINVFRISRSEVCRQAEVDTTIADGAYELLVEYIRLFGAKGPCNSPIFIL